MDATRTNPKRRSLMTRLRSSLLGSTPSDETGEENAHRFVRVVATLAREERVIICYPHGPFRKAKGGNHPRCGWVWMLNPLWRARVLELLADAPVKEAKFHEPDELDGWTFSAYSTVPVPRIAQLTLDQPF